MTDTALVDEAAGKSFLAGNALTAGVADSGLAGGSGNGLVAEEIGVALTAGMAGVALETGGTHIAMTSDIPDDFDNGSDFFKYS